MIDTAPRIYCITATEAPIVAVFRRGPSDWAHVGRWDLEAERYEPGAWFRGRIFARRSDLSPDGRLLAYFAHKPNAGWEHGDTYVGLSRLPWLSVLHAFGTGGTWTRGYHFTGEPAGERPAGMPEHLPYRLAPMPAAQFETERRRGWVEAADSPERHADDTWDQHRNARMHKPQPDGDRVLTVESVGLAGGEFDADQAIDGLDVRYAVEAGPSIDLLDDVQWADWDRRGRLLVATRAGSLQIRDLDATRPVAFEVDLSRLEPDPRPAPGWAHEW